MNVGKKKKCMWTRKTKQRKEQSEQLLNKSILQQSCFKYLDTEKVRYQRADINQGVVHMPLLLLATTGTIRSLFS